MAKLIPDENSSQPTLVPLASQLPNRPYGENKINKMGVLIATGFLFFVEHHLELTPTSVDHMNTILKFRVLGQKHRGQLPLRLIRRYSKIHALFFQIVILKFKVTANINAFDYR